MEGTTAPTATASSTQQATPQTTQNNTNPPKTAAQTGTGAPKSANPTATRESIFNQATQSNTEPPRGEDSWDEEVEGPALAKLLAKKSKTDAAFRFRHKGEEKPIETLDDLKNIILDAQRGRGANKLVEETKKEREAIAQQKQQMEAIQQAFASGDPELAEAALQFLAGDKAYDLAQSVAERRKQQTEEYAGLSDREKQLLERNKALESEFRRLQAEEARVKQEQIQKQKDAQIKQISEQARQNTKALIESMNLPEETMVAFGPHVVSVMREAIELGQEVGRDIPFEQLLPLAKERAIQSVIEPVRQLSPKAVVDIFGPQFIIAASKELMARQGRPVQQSMQQLQTQNKPNKNEESSGPQFGTRAYMRML